MFKALLRRIVAEEVERRLPEKEPLSLPAGYNPLDRVRGAVFHVVPVPFCGTLVWCKLRTLNATQVQACGDFGLIQEKLSKKEDAGAEDLIELRNAQESLIRATLVSPSFEEIERMIYDEDRVMASKLEEIADIERSAKETKDLTAEQRDEIETELDRLRLFTAFVLPEDTFGFLTSWALGVDVSDIKKIGREQLYRAAVLAVNGKDNPSDHLSGVFTDRDEEELNAAAWIVYNDYQAMKKVGKGEMRWIGGPNRNRR